MIKKTDSLFLEKIHGLMRIVLLILILTVIPAPAQDNKKEKTRGTIIVRMSDFNSDNGKVYVSLHDKSKPFPHNSGEAYSRGISKIKNKKSEYIFRNVPHGTYAIAVFHDENDNNKMDSNFLGIPSEGIGTSRNVKSTFGPPEFEEAKFVFKKDTLIIRIQIQ